jgi:hypothetical protein
MLDEKWDHAKEHETHMKTKNKINKHLLRNRRQVKEYIRGRQGKYEGKKNIKNIGKVVVYGIKLVNTCEVHVGTLGIINHKEHLDKKNIKLKKLYIYIYIYNKTKEHKLSTRWKNIGNSIWNFIGNKWVEQNP